MKDINYKEMGERVKEGRVKLKITQEKLSELVEVSPSYISEIERGTSICSLAVLVNIAEVLNLDIETLVNGTNKNNIDTTFSNILKEMPNKERKKYIDICIKISQCFK